MTYVLNGAPVETGGPEDRLLNWARVKDMTGISRTTAWRMQKAGDFPEPVPISPKRVGWWESELTAWKGSRKTLGQGRSLAPPRTPKLIETARSPRQSPTAPVAPAAPADAQPPRQRSNTVATAAPSLAPDTPQPTAPPRPGRRRRAASPDQIDFGF